MGTMNCLSVRKEPSANVEAEHLGAGGPMQDACKSGATDQLQRGGEGKKLTSHCLFL